MRKSLYILLFIYSFVTISAFAQTDSINGRPAKEHRPLKDRFYFGGNLGLQFGNQTYIDISPLVGYKITEKFSAGLGITYIYYKQRFPNYPQYNYETSIYGGRVFSRYYIIENLFAHTEIEMLNMEVFDVIKYEYKRKNILSPFVGAGYVQRFGQSSGIYIMLLYNLNDTPDSPYSNPVIRIGVNLGI